MSADRIIRIAAAVLLDAEGRMLVVRKSGTDAFMQPGGKLEPGESAAECLVRELDEELALAIPVEELVHLGRFAADAANEAGWRVDCDVYRVGALRLAALAQGAGTGTLAREVTVRAELAEARWCSRAELLELAADGILAPLTRDNLEIFLAD